MSTHIWGLLLAKLSGLVFIFYYNVISPAGSFQIYYRSRYFVKKKKRKKNPCLALSISEKREIMLALTLIVLVYPPPVRAQVALLLHPYCYNTDIITVKIHSLFVTLANYYQERISRNRKKTVRLNFRF